jgi:acyl carrier protein phosphodiesterase
VNYLAHAYLSFGVPEIVVGNLISDFIKGRKKLEYPIRIQSGISLHRSIDSFTDGHPVTRQAKSYFRAVYGLYSGALTDVVHDHFLANDPMAFSDAVAQPSVAQSAVPRPAIPEPVRPEPVGPAPVPAELPVLPLDAFSQKTYQQVAAWQAILPNGFANLFPYMTAQNWLYNYRFKEGIFKSFAGLSHRASYMRGPEQACELFEANYSELGACYREFFPLLKNFAFQELGRLDQHSGTGKIG